MLNPAIRNAIRAFRIAARFAAEIQAMTRAVDEGTAPVAINGAMAEHAYGRAARAFPPCSERHAGRDSQLAASGTRA